MDFFRFKRNDLQNGDYETIEQTLIYMLSHLECAKDIKITFSLSNPAVLFLNINLLEITRIQKRPNLKDHEDSPFQDRFYDLIHNLFFKVIGDIFSSFPVFQKIILSGQLEQDKYVVSVEIERQRWLKI